MHMITNHTNLIPSSNDTNLDIPNVAGFTNIQKDLMRCFRVNFMDLCFCTLFEVNPTSAAAAAAMNQKGIRTLFTNIKLF